MNIYVLRNDNVIESNCVNAQSRFSVIITIFDKLCDIVMIVRKYSINWIVLIQNCCRSHYKFICWYFFVSVHSQMMFLLFTQLELMIYVLIEVITSNYEYKNDVHGKNNSPIERNIKSYECMAWVVHQ